MSILQADAQYGEGFNHWLNVTVRATRSAQVRHWWAARGIIVSRLMRVRFGPVHLSRDLPRGHSRAMLASERNALINEIDAAAAAAATGAEPAARVAWSATCDFGRRRGLQQLRQVLLPHGGPGVRAVSMGLIRGRQQHEAPVLHALDFALGDPEFRRVDEIIGRVDLQSAAP